MSSECELDEGIKSIKSAWRREHTARVNLGKMLEQAEAENAKLRNESAKLRKLVVSYDSALRRMCDQMQRYVDCHNCILGKDYGDDSCAIDELREAACVTGVELE